MVLYVAMRFLRISMNIKGSEFWHVSNSNDCPVSMWMRFWQMDEYMVMEKLEDLFYTRFGAQVINYLCIFVNRSFGQCILRRLHPGTLLNRSCAPPKQCKTHHFIWNKPMRSFLPWWEPFLVSIWNLQIKLNDFLKVFFSQISMWTLNWPLKRFPLS